MQLEDNLEGLFADLKRPPDTLEDLKFVLSVIANIRATSLTVELKYRDIRERYRTLVMYDVQVPEEELKLSDGLEQMWLDLFKEAKMVDHSLVTEEEVHNNNL
ncbi:dynein axonemal heavy chain 10-like isoform X1 [Dysidea avara]|uniref:dynein axonemal heavy chain 10-like isoform X1 n=1 Tax=Dysidea avara TaxID=196820 RepID=UPI003321D3CF